MERVMKKRSILAALFAIIAFCAVMYVTTGTSYAVTDDTEGKAFYAEGSPISIDAITQEDRETYSEETAGKDVKINVMDWSLEGEDSVIGTYFVTKDYIIYGGGNDPDMTYEEANIQMYGGEVREIVAAGKNDVISDVASVGIYGGKVGTISYVENGSVSYVSVHIDGEDVSGSLSVGNIRVGALKTQTGSFISGSIKAVNHNSYIKLTPGYTGGRTLATALKDETDDLFMDLEITGSKFTGLDTFKSFVNCIVNNKVKIILNGNGGTFNGAATKTQYLTVTRNEDGELVFPDISTLTKPTRKGFTLIGWTEFKDEASNPDTIEDLERGASTYYACWKSNKDPSPYKLYVSYWRNDYSDESSGDSIEDIVGLWLDANYAEGYIPNDYDSEHPVMIKGTYPDGTKFEQPVTIDPETGYGKVRLPSTSVDKSVRKIFTFKVNKSESSYCADFDLGVWTWDNVSEDPGIADPLWIHADVDLNAALTDEGATVEIPYGSIDRGYSIQVQGMSKWSNAVVQDSDWDYYDEGTLGEEDFKPDDNGIIHLEIPVTGENGEAYTYKLNIKENTGNNVDFDELALSFWDGESWRTYWDDWKGAWEEGADSTEEYVDLDAAKSLAGADVVIPYFHNSECEISLWGLLADEKAAIGNIKADGEPITMDEYGEILFPPTTETLTFTVTGADGLTEQDYKINLTKDISGVDTSLKSLKLYCYDGYWNLDKEINVDKAAAATENGALVVLPYEPNSDAWPGIYLEAQTNNYGRCKIKGGSWISESSYTNVAEWPTMDKNNVVSFKVVSANGEKTKNYKVTVVWTGWYTADDGKYYYKDGATVEGLVTIGSYNYCFDAQGQMQTGIQRVGEDDYYFSSQTGRMLQSTWVTIGDNKYYVKKSGQLAKGFITIGSYNYCFNEQGKMQKGIQNIDSIDYYFSTVSGKMLKSQWVTIDNSKYYVKKSGQLAKGLITIGTYKYYFNDLGKMQKGIQAVNGIDYCFSTKYGRMYISKWLTIDGEKYYASKTGKLLKGLYTIGSYKYYFNNEGKMQKGIQNIGGIDYYFSGKTGRMLKSTWLTLDGSKYYVKTSGQLAKGLIAIGTYKYYFNDQGQRQSGIQEVAGVHYHFDSSKYDRMSRSKWLTVGGDKYYATKTGILKVGYAKIGSYYYYFNQQGKMQKGEVEVDGVTKYFDETTGREIKL